MSQADCIELFGNIHQIFFDESPDSETFCQITNKMIKGFDEETRLGFSALVSLEIIIEELVQYILADTPSP